MPQSHFAELRVQNKIPSGLSSIKEYYHKGQFHQRLKREALDPAENTPRLPASLLLCLSIISVVNNNINTFDHTCHWPNHLNLTNIINRG